MSDPQSDGIRAQQLLDDDLLQRMFKQAEDSAVDALAALTVKQCGDHAVLITLVQQLQAARFLPQQLKEAVTAKKEAERTPPAVA
jgi:hypothetical protein